MGSPQKGQAAHEARRARRNAIRRTERAVRARGVVCQDQRVHGALCTYHNDQFSLAWDGELDAHDACPSLVRGGSSCLNPVNYLAIPRRRGHAV